MTVEATSPALVLLARLLPPLYTAQTGASALVRETVFYSVFDIHIVDTSLPMK